MKKGIITVVGKDQVGIIANDVNILDISQTIVQGYFNMMMIVNHDASSKAFNDLADELAALGKEIGVDIKIQHEEIFNMMHRL